MTARNSVKRASVTARFRCVSATTATGLLRMSGGMWKRWRDRERWSFLTYCPMSTIEQYVLSAVIVALPDDE